MADPTSRSELIAYCKRRLGHPYHPIHLSDEQADDRVDQALRWYWDYHFNGAEHMYYKFEMTANNYSDKVYDLTVAAGGTGYSNADTVVFTTPTGAGSGANASITTDASGTIIAATLSANGNGDGYAVAPTVTVTSGTGSGASITAELGGFVPLPENIIGAVRLFPIGMSNSGTNNMFNIRYQIALNDLYTLTASSIVPYYSTFQHLRLIEEVLVGKAPIRYNRHKNRLYVDMDWNTVTEGAILIAECYQIVDPDTYTDVWKDHWLLRYTTALFKLQWGTNLKLFQGTMLAGNVQLNGQQIYDEASLEIEKLESEMVNTYSIPDSFLIG